MTARPFRVTLVHPCVGRYAGMGNYVRTWSPRYDPADITLPPGVQDLLDRYSEIAAQSS